MSFRGLDFGSGLSAYSDLLRQAYQDRLTQNSRDLQDQNIRESLPNAPVINPFYNQSPQEQLDPATQAMIEQVFPGSMNQSPMIPSNFGPGNQMGAPPPGNWQPFSPHEMPAAQPLMRDHMSIPGPGEMMADNRQPAQGTESRKTSTTTRSGGGVSPDLKKFAEDMYQRKLLRQNLEQSGAVPTRTMELINRYSNQKYLPRYMAENLMQLYKEDQASMGRQQNDGLAGLLRGAQGGTSTTNVVTKTQGGKNSALQDKLKEIKDYVETVQSNMSSRFKNVLKDPHYIQLQRELEAIKSGQASGGTNKPNVAAPGVDLSRKIKHISKKTGKAEIMTAADAIQMFPEEKEKIIQLLSGKK